MKKYLLWIVFIVLVAGSVTFYYYSIRERKKAFKIAAILPLSGDNANYGKWIKDGLELAKDEINKKGINGKSIEIIYEDDKAEPKTAVSAFQKLIQSDDPVIVFGPWASSCALAIAPLAERNRMPVLAEAQSPKISDAGEYIFRIQPDSRYYLKTLVPFVYNSLKLKNIAVLYVNNDYGVDQANIFELNFKKMGGNIVFKDGFQQGSTDFKTELEKIKATHPDGIFIPAYVEAGYILKQAKEIGLFSQFIGSAPMENPEIIRIAGDAANGVVYPHHFNPDSRDSIIRNFQNNYLNRYKTEAEGYAALAYDGLHVIKVLLEKCGTDKECIRAGFYSINYNGVTGRSSFDAKGDVIKPITIRKIVNKKFTTLLSN